MARNFKELEKKMSPAARKKASARAKEMMAEMLLAEIRKAVGLTQEELYLSEKIIRVPMKICHAETEF